MKKPIRMACESTVAILRLDRIFPTRKLDAAAKQSPKYKTIAASVGELDLIEPLVVFPQKEPADGFILLDGHVRYEILRDLERTEARCIIATEDEGFTYNHEVSRLSAIQEHFMIVRAIENGVSEDRIARTLNVDLASIKKKRNMLDGICPEAVEILAGQRTTADAFREIRKVKPVRQIEIAELMCASRNVSVNYAQCLVAATPAEQMLEPNRPREIRGLSPEDFAKMEHESEAFRQQFRAIEEAHGKNMLNMVVVAAYFRRLLGNSRVRRYLKQNHPEILEEFQKIAEATAERRYARKKGTGAQVDSRAT